jgi:hypothetical protein
VKPLSVLLEERVQLGRRPRQRHRVKPKQRSEHVPLSYQPVSVGSVKSVRSEELVSYQEALDKRHMYKTELRRICGRVLAAIRGYSLNAFMNSSYHRAFRLDLCGRTEGRDGDETGGGLQPPNRLTAKARVLRNTGHSQRVE